MNVKTFVDAYEAKKFMNTQQGVSERMEWIRKELNVRTYIPFREKRNIAEMIVSQNIKEADGIKRYDSVDGYVSLIIASIVAHTNLEFSSDPLADYDLLAASGLLSLIIAEFQGSHDEIGIVLKMVRDMELEDNTVGALMGRFLNKISGMLDGVNDTLKGKLAEFDLKSMFGADFNEENFAQIMGFIDKLK